MTEGPEALRTEVRSADVGRGEVRSADVMTEGHKAIGQRSYQ